MPQRLLAPGLGLLLLVLLEYSGLGTVLANNGLDLLFQLRGPRQPEQRLVLIGIDEPSLQHHGAWPFPRTLHAQLLDRLREARAVGFDFLFPEPAAGDDQLSRAMAAGPPVVLTVARAYDGQLLPPTATLSGQAGVGHVETLLSGDGIVRRFRPDALDGVPAFSRALLETAGLAAEAPAAGPLIINFYGPEQTFLFLSYTDVLAGRHPPAFFRDRLVLVGARAVGLGDAHVTSYTRLHPTPGVEIQATIISNALERSFIRPLPLAPILFVGVVCVLALFVWPVTGERFNLALNLGLVAVLLAAALVLFRSHRFLDFLPVLAMLFLTYLAHLFRQLLWAAGRILGEVRRLARALDAGLQQVCTSIPEPFIRAPARDRGVTVAGIQRHLDRLQAAVNALSLQHHFLDDLLKKELPPLILWERTSGRPVFANTAFVRFWQRFTGETQAPLPTSDTFRAALGNHQAESDPDAAPAGADPAAPCVDVEVRDDSGLRRYLQVRRHRLQATDVPFSGTLAVFQDVTELKELERVKDEVVSIVSHELKLPLTTILGYGEMLAMTLDGAPRQYAGEICSQSRRLNRMIEDFLDIARLESGRQRVRRYPFPPGRMLEDAVAGVAPRSRAKEIDIVLEQPERTSPLIGDESLLLQAVLNLLDNGVKFSPAHTTITLRLVEEPEQFVITIADQGPGIPAAERQAVFDKFQRGTQTGGAEGFGLGLHLVRQIIGLHDGEIAAVEAEAGACFRLTLPKRSDSEMEDVRGEEEKTSEESDGVG